MSAIRSIRFSIAWKKVFHTMENLPANSFFLNPNP